MWIPLHLPLPIALGDSCCPCCCIMLLLVGGCDFYFQQQCLLLCCMHEGIRHSAWTFFASSPWFVLDVCCFLSTFSNRQMSTCLFVVCWQVFVCCCLSIFSRQQVSTCLFSERSSCKLEAGERHTLLLPRKKLNTKPTDRNCGYSEIFMMSRWHMIQLYVTLVIF